MKFRLGPMPRDPAFEPEREGWMRVSEPPLPRMLLILLPLMVVLGLLSHLMYWLAGANVKPLMDIRNAPIGLAIIVAIAPFHELLHLLSLPGFGMNQESIVGFWPKMVVPYVYYKGVLPRNRYILICACPLLVLSILPLLIAFVRPHIPLIIIAVSYLNFLLSGMDLASIYLLLKHVPSGALVKNNGLDGYWRIKDNQDIP
ncbi:MAG TPA: DUF3267 domain-containing protein [Sedimentisphaerales bacterium]|nr:DUF3267 domain-containing protein [Sedimentisphaerales bacterium]